MRVRQGIIFVLLLFGLLGLSACTTTRGAGGSPVVDVSQAGGASATGAGAGGAYAEGAVAGGSYEPVGGCNVPQTAGFATNSYYFDFDKSDVNSQDMSTLQSLAQNMAANNSSLRVIGNTDDRGSREYNMALGWRRANAIASVLEQYGVAKKQIAANSNGAEKPIAFGSDETAWACNRRVDVIAPK